MRRVLVDLLFHSGSRGGTETYTREVYSRLHDAPDLEFVGWASNELAQADTSWFPGRIIPSGISGLNRARWAAGEVVALPRTARRMGADLIHSTANLGAVVGGVPSVLTLHDALAFAHPEWVPTPLFGGVLRWMIRAAARHATLIATDSISARDDIVRYLGVPSTRVEVIPLAASVNGPAPDVQRADDVLFVPGNRMPHKNVEILIRALALIPEKRRPLMRITGSRPGDPLIPLIDELGLGSRVELLGWISQDELEAAYASASAVVFPTRFEGFGLPILEAMQRGCPVICSDIPVLHEVAADAAVYVDPVDAASWARAITGLLDDPLRRSDLAGRGRVRSLAFSWDTTAAATLDLLRRAVGA